MKVLLLVAATVLSLADCEVITRHEQAAVADSREVPPAELLPQATCDNCWAFMPPRSDPAVVMQVVSTGYIDEVTKFVGLMEQNSAFTRDHVYLMCLDAESLEFAESLGISGVPVARLQHHTAHAVWTLRGRVVSCLLEAGYDVIMSDSDAYWLDDPMKELNLPELVGSSVVASRGSFPFDLGRKWGTTMCMGFIMFRGRGAAMKKFQRVVKEIIAEVGDDQRAVNRAASLLGIVWDSSSDMRYAGSTDFGRGVITDLAGDTNFTVTLLPHNKYTRDCARTPISNETTVEHCLRPSEKNSREGV